jgi:hypothetical protein
MHHMVVAPVVKVAMVQIVVHIAPVVQVQVAMQA